MSTIQFKTGTGSAVPANLTQGEVAINIDNGLFYYGSGSGNVTKKLEDFANITASGTVSVAGRFIGDTITLGDTEVTTPSYDFHIRNAGAATATIESWGNNNAILNFLTNQNNANGEPDFTIGQYHTDGGFQVRSDLKTFLTVGASDGDEIKASGSLNVTSDITSSGTVKATKFNGTRIVLARQSQYIATMVADNFYYGNNTQGHFHHQVSGKFAYPGSDKSPIGEQVGQGVQHNAILLPCDVYDIELKASARTNTDSAGFEFWLMKNNRAAAPSNPNHALVFIASASVDNVGSEGGEFFKMDITGSLTNATASQDEQLWVLVKHQNTASLSTVKYYWTLSAKTNE